MLTEFALQISSSAQMMEPTRRIGSVSPLPAAAWHTAPATVILPRPSRTVGGPGRDRLEDIPQDATTSTTPRSDHPIRSVEDLVAQPKSDQKTSGVTSNTTLDASPRLSLTRPPGGTNTRGSVLATAGKARTKTPGGRRKSSQGKPPAMSNPPRSPKPALKASPGATSSQETHAHVRDAVAIREQPPAGYLAISRKCSSCP